VSGDRLGVLAEPGFQALEPELVVLVKLHEETMGLKIIEFETEAVDAQEGSGDGDGCPFVAVNERMILGKALEQSRSLFNDVAIVATLRPGQRRLKGARSRTPGAPPNKVTSRAWTASTSSTEG
jgi:hypothetical protein